VETVPITLLAMACAELSGHATDALWRGGICLVLGRAIHVWAALHPRGWGLPRIVAMVLTFYAMAGFGIAWRSTWEVEHEVNAGALVPVLEQFAAPPNGIYAIVPHPTRQLPLRVRLWVDHLRERYGDPGFWRRPG